MWKRTRLVTRLLIMSLMALGLFGAGTTAASAQAGEVCRPNGALALADKNGDGVVSLGEIDGVIAAVGGNDKLQTVRDQAAAAGITGIRYTGCTPDGSSGNSGGSGTGTSGGSGSGVANGGTGNAATGGGSGTQVGSTSAGSTGSSSRAVTGADGQSGQGSASVAGEDGAAASNSLVKALPAVGVGETGDATPVSGSSLFLVGAGSLVMIAGALIFRAKKA